MLKPAFCLAGVEHMKELIRFTFVLGLSLGIDLAVASTLIYLAVASLPVAAAAGFAAGGLSNYVLHETWTFRGAKALREDRAALSLTRAGRYSIVLGAGFATRVGSVALLDATWPVLPVWAVLGVGILASFIVHFALSKAFVFQRPFPDQDFNHDP